MTKNPSIWLLELLVTIIMLFVVVVAERYYGRTFAQVKGKVVRYGVIRLVVSAIVRGLVILHDAREHYASAGEYMAIELDVPIKMALMHAIVFSLSLLALLYLLLKKPSSR